MSAAASRRARINTGKSSLTLRAYDIRGIAPEPTTRIEEGDVLVLLGAGKDLAAAEIKLVQG